MTVKFSRRGSLQPGCPQVSPSPGDSLQLQLLGNSKTPFYSSYRLGEAINEGCFGVVYKARPICDPKQTVAVKVIKRTRASDLKAFLKEASILRDLRNVPNVIKLLDVYADDNEMYMVQELAKGDVFDRLQLKEAYTEKDARTLAKILLTTIQSLHDHRIVHRDLKPENLLLKDEDDDTSILLCDFGTARYLPSGNIGLRSICGTPEFIAPEILEGAEYREEVDMWSIGCILFTLLGGYLPFGDRDETGALAERITAGQVVFDEIYWGGISEEAEQLILNLLTTDPKARLTASQALESEWFTRPTGDELEHSDLRISRNGIKHYCARRKFRAAINAVKLAVSNESHLWTSGSVLDGLESLNDGIHPHEKLWKSSQLDYRAKQSQDGVITWSRNR